MSAGRERFENAADASGESLGAGQAGIESPGRSGQGHRSAPALGRPSAGEATARCGARSSSAAEIEGFYAIDEVGRGELCSASFSNPLVLIGRKGRGTIEREGQATMTWCVPRGLRASPIRKSARSADGPPSRISRRLRDGGRQHVRLLAEVRASSIVAATSASGHIALELQACAIALAEAVHRDGTAQPPELRDLPAPGRTHTSSSTIVCAAEAHAAEVPPPFCHGASFIGMIVHPRTAGTNEPLIACRNKAAGLSSMQTSRASSTSLATTATPPRRACGTVRKCLPVTRVDQDVHGADHLGRTRRWGQDRL